MGRYSPSTSYGHRVSLIDTNCYRLSWVVDRYYEGSRLRHPTTTTRDTDLAGAKRFAAKWNIAIPVEDKS